MQNLVTELALLWPVCVLTLHRAIRGDTASLFLQTDLGATSARAALLPPFSIWSIRGIMSRNGTTGQQGRPRRRDRLAEGVHEPIVWQ